jgi:tripartite-type tricarboxylate transporter receptor subunit TctC
VPAHAEVPPEETMNRSGNKTIQNLVLSFPRRRKAAEFKRFWMLACAGMTLFARFPKDIKQVVIAIIAAATSTAFAQNKPIAGTDYPRKPVRVIVAAAPGGGTDISARLVMGKVSERVNQSFVIEARPGASGTIAADMVAKATPDGYTLLAAAMSTMCTVPLINKVSYDAHKDFQPISQFIAQPSVLAITALLPVNSVSDLIALAKSKPGTLNYASTGIGTSTHLSMELFKSMAGIKIENISYKGSGETVLALVGGHVHLLFASAPAVVGQAKTGKIKMLAVTSAKRSELLPDLPSVAESGVPGFEVVGWYGLLAPRRTPDAIVVGLNRDISQILQSADVRSKMAADGAETTPGSMADFSNLIDREIAKWKKLLKESDLKL